MYKGVAVLKSKENTNLPDKDLAICGSGDESSTFTSSFVSSILRCNCELVSADNSINELESSNS